MGQPVGWLTQGAVVQITTALKGGIAILVAVATFACADAASAAATIWTPTSVKGIVVYLLDGKWEELSRGQALSQATLRTLRSGRLSLAGPNVILDVGPNSALQVAVKPDGSAGTIEQYLGSIKVATQQSDAGLTVRAGKVILSNITGELSLLVADTGTSIVIASGTAAVTSGGGKKLVLAAGSYSADATGLIVVQEGAGTSVQTAEQTESVGATEAAANSAAANGAANIGGNGEGSGGGGANGGGGGGNWNGNNGNGKGNGGGDGSNGNGNGNNGNGNKGNGNGNGKP